MNKSLAVIFLALISASGSVDAATVVAVDPQPSTGGGGFGLAYLYGANPFTTILAVGWTSSLSFSDVTVTTQMASSNPVGATGHAYLDTPTLRLDSVREQRSLTRWPQLALYFRPISI